eukprot:305196_1
MVRQLKIRCKHKHYNSDANDAPKPPPRIIDSFGNQHQSHHDDIHSAHSFQFDDPNHYDPLIGEQYNNIPRSGSPLLVGGVVGASAIIAILMIFCLDLACGMILYLRCTRKKASNPKRTEKGMVFIEVPTEDEDDNNDNNIDNNIDV